MSEVTPNEDLSRERPIRATRRITDAVIVRGRHLISGVIAAASIVAVLSTAALADDAAASRLAGDITLAKETIALLVAKDFAAVRGRLDPALGQVSDDTLRKMSDLFGAGEASSIETIWSSEGHSLETGNGNSRIVLEYALPGKWVVADVVVKTEGGLKTFPRLFFTPNNMPLKDLNAFHLFGKGPKQYLFLACWIAMIACVGWAVAIAFRRHTGWRRWGLILLIPLGLTPTVAMNWNTAQVWILEAASNAAGSVIPIVSLRYPMTLYGFTEVHATYLTISAPLFAFGYLIWQRWRAPIKPREA